MFLSSSLAGIAYLFESFCPSVCLSLCEYSGASSRSLLFVCLAARLSLYPALLFLFQSFSVSVRLSLFQMVRRSLCRFFVHLSVFSMVLRVVGCLAVYCVLAFFFHFVLFIL